MPLYKIIIGLTGLGLTIVAFVTILIGAILNRRKYERWLLKRKKNVKKDKHN